MEQNTTNGLDNALSNSRGADSPTRESDHTNNNLESHERHQNGSTHKGAPQFVDEGIGEDLQEVASAPALQTTCGCAFSSAEHRNHLENIAIFPGQLQKALKSMSPSQQQYDSICVVSVYWQASDTPELKADAEYLQDVLKKGYGYDVRPYMLENRNYRIQKIRLDLVDKLMEVRKYIDDPNMNNLFILLYAGHGGRSKDELEYFWQPDASTQTKDALKWTDHEAIIENFESGYAVSKSSEQQVPMTCAVFKHRVKSTKKDAAKPYTLTSAFAAELERRKDDNGTDVSYIINYMQGKKASQKYHLTPSPTYRRNHPHSEMPRSSSIFIKSKLKVSTGVAKTRAEYINEVSCLNDLRVVITLRLTNLAERLVVEDYKHWFYYRPQNFDHDNVSVEIECYGLAESNSSLAVLSLPWWLWNLLPPNPAYESVGIVRSHNFAPKNTPPDTVKYFLPKKPSGDVTIHSPWEKAKGRQIDYRPQLKSTLAIEASSTLPVADFRRAPKPHTLLEHPQHDSRLPRHQGIARATRPFDVRTTMERRLQSQDMKDVSQRVSRFDRTDTSIFSMIAKVARPLAASLMK